MISPDRIRSVRIALDTCRFSSSSGEVAAVASSPWPWPVSAPMIFSAASKHRKAPPAIRIGVIAQGASALRISAAGSRNSSLLRREPLAIFQMIGSSRAGLRPTT